MASLFWLTLSPASAHQSAHSAQQFTQQGQKTSTATYLGNAGVLISGQKAKILFDPFFHNHYGQYILEPDSIRAQIFANQAPDDQKGAQMSAFFYL